MGGSLNTPMLILPSRMKVKSTGSSPSKCTGVVAIGAGVAAIGAGAAAGTADTIGAVAIGIRA